MKFLQVIFFLFYAVSGIQAQTIPVFDLEDIAIYKKGKIVFPSTEKFTFQGNLAPVILKNNSGQKLIGFVDKKGRLAVPAEYEGVGEVRNGNFIVSKGGRY